MLEKNKRNICIIFLCIGLMILGGIAALHGTKQNQTKVAKQETESEMVTKQEELTAVEVVNLNDEIPEPEIPEFLRQYKEVVDGKSIVITEKDSIKIYESCDKTSKVLGYLMNSTVLRVIEDNGEWLKVHSGKIDGYVKSKYIVSGENAETFIIDEGMLYAKIIKDKIAITKEKKSNGTTVGMGYKGQNYLVLGFSNDYKKVRVEKSETVEGWIQTKHVEFKIKSPKAMTKKAYKKALKEQNAKREQAFREKFASFSKNSSSLTGQILYILSCNESGTYTAARNPLERYPGEKTITVGAWQWYGERAHKLLRRIVQANESKAQDILCDAFSGSNKSRKKKGKKLLDDILEISNWESDGRIFDKEEILAIKSLLGTADGISIQKAQATSDVDARIRMAKNTFKVTNDQVIAYFVDLHWQSPENAIAIFKESIATYDTAYEFSHASEALDVIHKIAMKNRVMREFSYRRNFTYKACKKISYKNDSNSKQKEAGMNGEKDKVVRKNVENEKETNETKEEPTTVYLETTTENKEIANETESILENEMTTKQEESQKE